MANANPSRIRNGEKPKVEKPTPEQVKEAEELKLQDDFVKIGEGNGTAILTRFTGTLPQGN